MSLSNHARRELELAGLLSPESDYGGMLGDAVLQLIDTFSAQGHSGASAEVVIDLFSRVARYEILTPIVEDKPEDWHDVSEPSGYPCFQHRRLSRLFKDGEGVMRLHGAVVSIDPSGERFHGPAIEVKLPIMSDVKERHVDFDGNEIPQVVWERLNSEHRELLDVGVEEIDDLDARNLVVEELIPVPTTLTGSDAALEAVQYAHDHEKILYTSVDGLKTLLLNEKFLADWQPAKQYSLMIGRGYCGTWHGTPVVTTGYLDPTKYNHLIGIEGLYFTTAVSTDNEEN